MNRIAVRLAGSFRALAVGCFLAAPPSLAQEIPPSDVVLGNRVIVTLRGVLLENPPAERARVANQRIAAALKAGGDLTVAVKPADTGRLFSIGGHGVFMVTPDDLDEAAGQTLDAAAAEVERRLDSAIRETQEERSLPTLLLAFGLSVAATLLAVLVLAGVERLRRWSSRKATAAAHARLGTRIPEGSAGEPDRLHSITKRVLLTVARAVDLVVVYVWLTFVLERFAFTRPWGEQLGAWLLGAASNLGLAALKALPNLVIVVLILLATRWLLILVDYVFSAIEEGRIEVGEALRETTQPTRRIVAVVFWTFALIMSYPYLPGSGSEAFKGVSVMVGLMVSIGSSALVGQLASGLMILYSRTLRVGDFVKAGDVEGTVAELGLFTTRIRTVKQEIVVIPNALLSGQVTKNYSQTPDPNGVVLGTSLTIGYDTPWRQVEGLLLLAAEKTTGLRKEPVPWVHQRGLSDFYVEYEVCAYLEDPRTRVETLTALHANILDAFNEHGVQIMSPSYEADPEGPKIVPRDRWFTAPARRRPEGP